MSTQRYVSDELTHFVGRDLMSAGAEDNLEDREERLYGRLVAILREGCLKSCGRQTGVNADPAIDKEGITVQRVITYEVGSDDLRHMFDPSVVCFCDIPVGDVAIHIAKYGPFGVAFGREFLLGRGTNPVLYLAEDAVVDEGPEAFGELFATEMHRVLRLLTEL